MSDDETTPPFHTRDATQRSRLDMSKVKTIRVDLSKVTTPMQRKKAAEERRAAALARKEAYRARLAARKKERDDGRGE